MIIAFLSDIHANLPALRAALSLAGERGAERIVVCGDIVGDGPFPAETVELLRTQRDFAAIRGNVDRKILRQASRKRKKIKERLKYGSAKQKNQAWTALQLSEGDQEWLGHLPPELRFRADDQEVLAVHGSPEGDTDYLYPSLTDEGLENKFRSYDGPRPTLLVSGHSHVPFAKTVNGTTVVNCGSVGRPADGDPRGSLVIADIPKEGAPSVEVVRFLYPIEELLQAVTDRDVPGIDVREYVAGVKLA